jgi:hypothetical protein
VGYSNVQSVEFDFSTSSSLTETATPSASVNVNQDDGTLDLSGSSSMALSALNLASGTSAILAISDGAESQLWLNGGLSLGTGATLDLTDNQLFIHYNPSGPDPMGTIFGYIQSGYDGGLWNGTGIISSTAAASGGSYGLGYSDSIDPGNPAYLRSGTIEVMYTLYGDANLDGKVNGSDFTLMSASFNDAVTNGWDAGDFNYSGTVNGVDFILMSDNFNQAISLPAAVETDPSTTPTPTNTTPTATTPTATTIDAPTTDAAPVTPAVPTAPTSSPSAPTTPASVVTTGQKAKSKKPSVKADFAAAPVESSTTSTVKNKDSKGDAKLLKDR